MLARNKRGSVHEQEEYNPITATIDTASAMAVADTPMITPENVRIKDAKNYLKAVNDRLQKAGKRETTRAELRNMLADEGMLINFANNMMLLREKYKNQLAENPELRDQLATIEADFWQMLGVNIRFIEQKREEEKKREKKEETRQGHRTMNEQKKRLNELTAHIATDNKNSTQELSLANVLEAVTTSAEIDTEHELNATATEHDTTDTTQQTYPYAAFLGLHTNHEYEPKTHSANPVENKAQELFAKLSAAEKQTFEETCKKMFEALHITNIQTFTDLAYNALTSVENGNQGVTPEQMLKFMVAAHNHIFDGDFNFQQQLSAEQIQSKMNALLEETGYDIKLFIDAFDNATSRDSTTQEQLNQMRNAVNSALKTEEKQRTNKETKTKNGTPLAEKTGKANTAFATRVKRGGKSPAARRGFKQELPRDGDRQNGR